MNVGTYRILHRHGFIVALLSEPFRVEERVSRHIGKRPTVDYENLHDFVHTMMKQWEEVYPYCDCVIDTTRGEHHRSSNPLSIKSTKGMCNSLPGKKEIDENDQQNRSIDQRRGCPGMNAAIRGVTRYAIQKGLTVEGIIRGYEGLLSHETRPLGRRDVGAIIHRGGTMLRTARCLEFKEKETQKKPLLICVNWK